MRPENGLHFHYDSIASDTFYRNIAQFAPYLTKNAIWQPIYMIYCNRQLVYWYDVDDNPRYSFIGREGYNQIILRGQEWEYTIDSVWLEKGKKLEFSLEEGFLNGRVKKKLVGKELTYHEKDILQSTTFILKKSHESPTAIWQENNIHFLNNQKRNMKIGPFFQGKTDSLTLETEKGLSNTFQFESGFSYEIGDNRERLYDYKITELWKKKKLPKFYDWEGKHHLGELAYSFSDIRKYLNKDKIKPFVWLSGFEDKRGGDFYFELPKDSLFSAIILEQNDTIQLFISPNRKNISNLKTGDYDIYFFTYFGEYLHEKITILPNTLLFKNLEKYPFQKDTTDQILKDFFEKRDKFSKKGESKNYSPVSDSFQDFSNYYSGLTGIITEEESEDPVIFGNVLAYQNGIVITGTETDFDGNYHLSLPPGFYDIEVSYIGFSTKRVEGVIISGNQRRRLDIALSGGIDLEEVVVVGYSVAGKRSAFSAVPTGISIAQERKMQRGLFKTTFNKFSENDEAIDIRGSRANPTNYYLDGVRVSGNKNYKPQNPLSQNTLRTQFSDYAYWQPNLTTDQNGEAYFQATFPDNITSWKTFVLGMDHKERGGTSFAETHAFKKLMGQLALPRFLIEGDKTEIVGKSINYTNDTFSVQTTFKLGEEKLQEKSHEIVEAVIEKMKITAPSPTDSLQLTYFLQSGEYGDGEQRNIPVFRKGVSETVGDFYILESDTSIVFKPKLETKEVTIFAMDDALDVMLESIEYLKNYPYGCNEQTASRLLALLMEKQIREHLNQPFENEAALIKAIVRLKKTQNADGSWGWWSGGNSNSWMTNYVLKALYQANKNGYKTEAFERGLRYVSNHLNQFENRELLNALDLFSEINQNVDYQQFISKIDTVLKTQYDQFLTTKIRQKTNLDYQLDSLFKYQKETTFGSLYWGEEGYGFRNNSIQNTLLAYQIFQQEGRKDICKKIRQYFLEGTNNQSQLGRNTFETAQVLVTILPNLLENVENFQIRKAVLQLPNGETISKFPFQKTIPIGQFSDNFKLEKTGSEQLFISVSQTFHNSNPQPKSDLFEIKTSLIQNGKTVKNQVLEIGDDTKLIVDLKVTKSADYVMIEVPIPAGCSYGQKQKYHRNPEVHREYFKQKTSIFCEKLEVGEYRFEINLEPRYSGIYALNPTKVEQMYFPVFYGRNGMKRVEMK